MRSSHGGSEPGGAEPWGALTAAAQSLAGEDVVGWSDEQVRDGMCALLAEVNRLDAIVSTVVASFETRGLSERDGFRTTRSWLMAYGQMTQGAASGWLSRARLHRALPALSAAARNGEVSVEHLRRVDDLAGHVGLDAVRDFDEILARLAATTPPGDVELACGRIRAHLDPDGAEPDPDAAQRRGLSIARVGSLLSVRGQLDLEGGATLMTALDALMQPPSADDPRTAAQRRADAMVELARQALSGGTLPTVGGVRPQLGLLLTPATLMRARDEAGLPQPRAAAGDENPGDGPASGNAAGFSVRDALECSGVPPAPDLPWSSWAGELPVAVAQRLACDCEVWRVVLDPVTGLPLEVGRAHRIVPTWMRKALHARDRVCRWPGCAIPAAWTQVHHLLAWYYGGRTDINNCLLLCTFHHGLVHEGLPSNQRWRIELDPETGEVHVWRPNGEPYELGPSRPFVPRGG